MAVIGYLRISTVKQDISNQRLELLDYANLNRITIDQFVEVEMTSRRGTKERKVDELLALLNRGDTLVVSELSRIGRSLGEIIAVVDELIKKGVIFVALKQNWTVRQNDLATKALKAVFGLLAELERDLISERTRLALAAKKTLGVKLGRPKGSLGTSKLDARRREIEDLFRYKASMSFVARKLGVSRTTLIEYVRSRNLRTQ
jgi:DNA invertase Pin-like site-specific DNA recombinase